MLPKANSDSDGNKKELSAFVGRGTKANMSHSFVDGGLDGEIQLAEIARCLRSLKSNMTGGSDGLVGELMKYGEMGMVDLLC